MISTMSSTNRICVIIPAYFEEKRVGEVIKGVHQHCPDVLVVDDGSTDRTSEVARAAGAAVIRLEVNQGKGAALNAGFSYARANHFDAVVTMDADGQHDPADLPAFLDAYQREKIPVLIGNRMAQCGGMPLVRRMTNRFMSWLLSREMGQRVPDSQSGYRLYQCAVLPSVPVDAPRYAAESEILLDLAWRGVRMGAVPIRVIYRDEKSKIRPVRDSIRFFSMLHRWRRKKRCGGAKSLSENPLGS